MALEEELPVHLLPWLLYGKFKKRSGFVSLTDEAEGERQCPVAVWQGEEALTGKKGLTEQPWDSHSLHLTIFSAV